MVAYVFLLCCVFFFQAEDGIRDLVRSRGLGDVYKRQAKEKAKRKKYADSRRAALKANPEKAAKEKERARPVSYTHLTLPTIYSV